MMVFVLLRLMDTTQSSKMCLESYKGWLACIFIVHICLHLYRCLSIFSLDQVSLKCKHSVLLLSFRQGGWSSVIYVCVC